MDPSNRSPITVRNGGSQLQECQNRLRQAEREIRKYKSTNQALQAALEDAKKTNTIVVGKLQSTKRRLQETMLESMVAKNNNRPTTVQNNNDEGGHDLHTTTQQLKEALAKLKEKNDKIGHLTTSFNFVTKEHGRLTTTLNDRKTTHEAERTLLYKNLASMVQEKQQMVEELRVLKIELSELKTKIATDNATLMTESKQKDTSKEIQPLETVLDEQKSEKEHAAASSVTTPAQEREPKVDELMTRLKSLAREYGQLTKVCVDQKAAFEAEIRELKRKGSVVCIQKDDSSLTNEQNAIQAAAGVVTQTEDPQEVTPADNQAELSASRNLAGLTTTAKESNQKTTSPEIQPLERVLDEQQSEKEHAVASSVTTPAQEREPKVDELMARLKSLAREYGQLTKACADQKAAFEAEIRELKRKGCVVCTHKDNPLTNEHNAIHPAAGVVRQMEDPQEKTPADNQVERSASCNLAGFTTTAKDTTSKKNDHLSTTTTHATKSSAETTSPSLERDSSIDDNSTVAYAEMLVCSVKGPPQRVDLAEPTPPSSVNEKDSGENRTGKRKVDPAIWWKNYQRLKRFKTEHGHLNATDDDLASWIQEQRTQLRDVGCDMRVGSLDNIGFEWNESSIIGQDQN